MTGYTLIVYVYFVKRKMQPQQKNFQSEFWSRLSHPKTKGDLAARDVMGKVERVFSSRKHRLVVILLDAISDPRTQKHLKQEGAVINAKLLQCFFPSPPQGELPPRGELRKLARKLLTISRELEAFGAKGVSPKRDFFLKLAEDCRSGVKFLKYFDMARAMDPTPKSPRGLTYKAFWKHLPIAKLCRELEAPWAVSFEEIETLLRCAYSVRGLPFPRPARSIEREYSGFRKLKSSDPLKSAAWPKVLDRFLLVTLATK